MFIIIIVWVDPRVIYRNQNNVQHSPLKKDFQFVTLLRALRGILHCRPLGQNSQFLGVWTYSLRLCGSILPPKYTFGAELVSDKSHIKHHTFALLCLARPLSLFPLLVAKGGGRRCRMKESVRQVSSHWRKRRRRTRGATQCERASKANQPAREWKRERKRETSGETHFFLRVWGCAASINWPWPRPATQLNQTWTHNQTFHAGCAAVAWNEKTSEREREWGKEKGGPHSPTHFSLSTFYSLFLLSLSLLFSFFRWFCLRVSLCHSSRTSRTQKREEKQQEGKKK